jgi:hypothetical protein
VGACGGSSTGAARFSADPWLNRAIEDLVADEDKEKQGSANRAAFEDVMMDGKVSLGTNLERAIEDDDMAKARDLLLEARWTGIETENQGGEESPLVRMGRRVPS